ncbi:5'/3'-nucleotidase SurE [Galenea microaerophila]
MKILLSNDDGFFAPGIQALAQALLESDFCQEFVVMAPDRNRSAASNSLTLTEPLRMTRRNEYAFPVYAVNGTPTDCVHLGMNGGLPFTFDLVVSGINAGANMGDDVLYSGTVAAATEGRFLGKPSVAISLCGDQHFETAVAAFMQFMQQVYFKVPVPESTIFNLNVPDIPLSELKGLQVTRLGRRHASEPIVADKDPRGLPIFWVGPAGDAADASKETDFYAVENKYASLTPLHIDLTNYDLLKVLRDAAKE